MDIHVILAEYDKMFGQYPLSEIEQFLADKIRLAKEKSENGVLFTLLNEMIGFCRDTTQKDKALSYCNELLLLMDSMGLKGSMEYATSLINVANAFRAFGLLKEAIKLFETVKMIYDQNLDKQDFGYANLYNNWGLAYQELGDYAMAKVTLLKALHVVDLYDEALIQQATTRTNLAASLLQLGTEKDFNEAMLYLQRALSIHEKFNGQDFHYGATLVAMGDALYSQKKFDQALSYYGKGLNEIEKHTGKNDNYNRVLEKYNYTNSLCRNNGTWKSNLDRSKEFYENSGKKMILTHFAELKDRIAVGMVGEGSDCYGFDDEISSDHDYEVGFCIWLTEEDYKKYGAKLQEKYNELVKNTGRLASRRGVFSISGFYNTYLQTSINFEKDFSLNYETLEEFRLAEATNGEVFFDALGLFTKVRNKLLAYYPEQIWRKKLAQAIHDFSQFAQSNYSRMMARKDYLTANLCVSKAIETTMDLIYLLNKTYAPYYKWKKKGLEKFNISKKIIPVLDEIVTLPVQSIAWETKKYDATLVNEEDGCVVLFERIAQMILDELKRLQLVSGDELFLEVYIGQILEGNNMNIVDKIIELEWKQFDKVKNEGGRADCQDNFPTFSIMRKSQYLTWSDDLLNSYYQDLLSAEEKSWNLITEKYARMMESTNPDKYRQLEKSLPVISSKRKTIQEEIIQIQVNWMEEFAKQFPKMAGNARAIRTSQDTPYDTSYETYLRGEISTYSRNTFVLYCSFIISLMINNENLAKKIMENTARLYGYQSLDDAENKL